jgi:hypothetical protein
VRLGKPKNPENYEKFEIGEIRVYYKSSMADLFSRITVKLERLLFIKSLVATGDK